LKPLLSEYITRQRLRMVRPYLKGDILDLGCGYTRIPFLLDPDQAYVGIDHDPTVIQWGRNRYPKHKFYLLDLEEDQSQNLRHYDTVLMIAVLEHLDRPGAILQQVTKFIVPTGNLVITTPTPLGGFIHSIGTHLGLFYQEAKEDHKRFYSRKLLEKTLQIHNLSINLYRKFLWSGNQLAVCSRS
jgi:2-polyprenyl-3-methyl-5-hydroxy-6-metoxy-1,4-benzoquinol methylase